jgi:hypothetical protein
VKVIVTIAVEVERADGSYSKTVERRDHACGDNPLYESTECAKAIDAATTVINRRIEDRAGGSPLSASPGIADATRSAMDHAWGSIWLHGEWRYLTSKMTTPQRELAADGVARWSAELAAVDNDPDRGEPEGLRWWREDEQQAAASLPAAEDGE